jgi:hypothetical protein
MSSNTLHSVSTVVSPTGFALFHLSQDEVDSLKEKASDLRKDLTKDTPYQLTDFNTLDKAVEIIKKLFPNLNGFANMQVAVRAPVMNVELINDMISIAKGKQAIVPIEFRVGLGEDTRTTYPKLEDILDNRFLWIETAFKTNFPQLIKRTLYVLGEHNES